jgi:lipopolysaccharide export system permease protein
MPKFKPLYSLSSLLPFTILDRYIASELIPPFLFGVGAFGSIVLAIDSLYELMRKIVESGLPITTALQVFLFNLPYAIAFGFPMSTLLATLMTYSRLSSESELIAMRGCGVSAYRMTLTAVMLSVVVSGLTFLFNEQIAPAGKNQAAIILEQAIKSDKPLIKKDNFILPETQDVKKADGTKEKVLKRLYYADQFDGRQFRGLTIVDRSRDNVNQIVLAESAQWNIKNNQWDVYNGTAYLIAPDRSYRNIVQFQHYEMKLPRTAFDLANRDKSSEEMNIVEAMQQLEVEKLGGDEKKIRKLEVRIQQKIALPFVCVIFGLVGAAMGNIPQRRGTGRGTSFGITIVVVFSYYTIMQVSGSLGQAGILSPIVGAWLPNIIGLVAGIFLLIRVGQK